MNRTIERVGLTAWLLMAVAAMAAGPVDLPLSAEPRVVVAKSKALAGFVSSEGRLQAFTRVHDGDDLYSRDLLVCLPGFQATVEPASKAVELLLWGNLPGLSSSSVLESAVILHDTKAYDLDVTLVRGRVVLKNTKAKGEAKVWLRTPNGGVQLTLREPGDKVAMEIYSRWPAGVPFSLTRRPGLGPIGMWEVYVLKGALDIKAGKTEWAMQAHPGRSYFHGDTVKGPASEGPQSVKKAPAWANPTGPTSFKEKLIAAVIKEYRDRLKTDNAEEAGLALLALADKDTLKPRATMLRTLVVHAAAALDAVGRVAGMLETTKDAEARQAAVVGLRHWIGANEGRDLILYRVLMDRDGLNFSKPEAMAVMQLLHSPFSPEVPETYETLIAYLNHRRQAVRELAHWHLVRLAPGGKEITYDASASAADRGKAIAAWKKLIPPGKLPEPKKDDTKKDGDKKDGDKKDR
jgi:hypothetical protein